MLQVIPASLTEFDSRNPNYYSFRDGQVLAGNVAEAKYQDAIDSAGLLGCIASPLAEASVMSAGSIMINGKSHFEQADRPSHEVIDDIGGRMP